MGIPKPWGVRLGSATMARARRQAMLRDVEPTNVEISLRVEVAGDEVRGSACCGREAEREFCGWIGLIATIDELIAAAQRRDAHPSS